MEERLKREFVVSFIVGGATHISRDLFRKLPQVREQQIRLPQLVLCALHYGFHPRSLNRRQHDRRGEPWRLAADDDLCASNRRNSTVTWAATFRGTQQMGTAIPTRGSPGEAHFVRPSQSFESLAYPALTPKPPETTVHETLEFMVERKGIRCARKTLVNNEYYFL